MDLSLLDGVLVIVILVFCALVAVMAPLRSPLFSSFVRGFTSKDAKSDEEIQEHVKFINWKKGFFRLTLVLSVLFGVVSGIVNTEHNRIDSVEIFLEGFFMFFALTWLVYFMVGFVIRGFASKR